MLLEIPEDRTAPDISSHTTRNCFLPDEADQLLFPPPRWTMVSTQTTTQWKVKDSSTGDKTAVA